MPDSYSSKIDTSKINGTPEYSAVSFSENGCSTISVSHRLHGDLSDTAEDLTTDTVSKGRLKHELRMTRTKLATKALTLENNEKLSNARESELQDEIRTLSRRLALSDTRCEAAMLVASQAAQIEDQLINAVQVKKQLTRDNAQLAHEMNAIRQFFTQLPIERLVYTVEGPERAFEINVSSYSQLNNVDFERLREQAFTELSMLDLIKVSTHRLVTLFSEEIARLRRQLEGAAESLLLDSAKNPFFLTDLASRQPMPEKQLCSKQVHFASTTELTKCTKDEICTNEPEETVRNPAHPDKTEHFGISLELQTANKQIELLRQDKEYLSKQISNLTDRLTTAERDLALEKHHVSSVTAELEQFRSKANRNENLMSQQVELNLRNQLNELNGLTGQELARIRAFHDEIQSKEIERLRNQRDKALAECETLKLELKLTNEQLQERKADLCALKPSDPVQVPSNGQTIHTEDFNTRKRLVKLTIELEATKSAKIDAMLQVEKLVAQLNESKLAFYELRSKSHQDRTQLEAKISNLERKLAAYEEMENAIDEAVEVAASTDSTQENRQLVQRLEHLCVEGCLTTSGSLFLPTLAARRLEHCMKLTKQVTQLKVECEKLKTERDSGLQEIKVAKAELERNANLISLMTQPADCLALALTRKDKKLHACRTELEQLRQQRTQMQQDCDRLQSERDALARDLERVLSRRKNIANFRKQLTQLLQERNQLCAGRRGCTACNMQRVASLDRSDKIPSAYDSSATSVRLMPRKQLSARFDPRNRKINPAAFRAICDKFSLDIQ